QHLSLPPEPAPRLHRPRRAGARGPHHAAARGRSPARPRRGRPRGVGTGLTARSRRDQPLHLRSRSEFVTTLTLESAIASDATIGWSVPFQPATGPIAPPGASRNASAPAASGRPITL